MDCGLDMNQELDKLLCEKYPKMMINRNRPMTETTMYWGFECGDGWFNIIDKLMGNIQHYIDWKNRDSEVVNQVTVDQVKEKFGTLRFYYTGGDNYVQGLVSMAESMSSVTCDKCGNSGELRKGGWLRTLCEPHDQERINASTKSN
jgi:hypothetical protein